MGEYDFLPDQGPLLSFLDWIDQLGQASRNVIKGRPAAAGRHVRDFFKKIPDAVVPGELFADEATREDYIEPSELVGMDDSTPWYVRVPTNLGLGIATDPLSLVSFGALPSATRAARMARAGKEVPKGGGVKLKIPFGPDLTPTLFEGQAVDPLSLASRGVSKAVDALPAKPRQALTDAGIKLRSMVGAERLSAPAEEILQAADATRAKVGQASAAAADDVFRGLTPEQDQQAYLLARNLRQVDERTYDWITPPSSDEVLEDIESQVARVRADGAREGMDPKVIAAAERALRLGNQQWQELLDDYPVLRKPQRLFDSQGRMRDERALSKLFRLELRNDQKLRDWARQMLQTGEYEAAHAAGKLDEALRQSAPVGRVQEIEQALQKAHDQMDTVGFTASAPPVPREFEQWLESNGIRRTDVPGTYSPRNYLMASYEGMDDATRAIDTRTIRTPQDLNQLLAKEKNLKLETSLAKALLQRSDQQAQLASMGEIGRRLSDGKGLEFRVAAEDARTTVANLLEQFDPESAHALREAYFGKQPRGGFYRALAHMNRYFKPYVVAGFILPRFSANLRNRISGPLMVGATPGAEAALPRAANPLQIASDVVNSLAEAYGINMGGDLVQQLRTVEDAYRKSGGRAKRAVEILRKDGHEELAQAVDQGVLDTFASSEQLLRTFSTTGWRKHLMDLIDKPMKVFQLTESHMRLGTFLDLLRKGREAPEEAARLTKEALYNYNISSSLNDRYRQIVPFGQFLGKSAVQQAKHLSRTPAMGVAMAQLFGQDEDAPVYPYLAEKAGFRVGPGEYVGGLGLPIETLSAIPSMGNIGRGFEKAVVASSQPLLKTAYAVTSGQDPYFGTPFGSYDKPPQALQALGADEHSEFGRWYNIATGLGINPLQPMFGQLDPLLDQKRSPGARALDLLTGANVVDVDEDRALKQILEDKLRRNPEIRQYTSLYQSGDDPETEALLKEYNRVRAAIKERRAKENQMSVL